MPHVPQDGIATIERALTLQEGWDKALEVVAKLKADAATPAERAAAEAQHCNDECEIDDDAGTSRADTGTWVQAWVWVPYPDCKACDGEGEDCETCNGSGKQGGFDGPETA